MKYSVAILLSSLVALCGTLSAQTVTISPSFTGASAVDPVAMVNNGGLNGPGGRMISNGDAELVFPITIDDSAGTGAIFQGVLTLSGSASSAATPSLQVTNGGGIFFSGGGTRILNYDFSGLTETTSTGLPIMFDGLSDINIVGATATANADIGADAENGGGGIDFAGDVAINGSGPFSPPVSSGPLQVQVHRDSGAFTLTGQTFQFTIGDSMVVKGDVNLDGVVSFLDITPFILVLSNNEFQAEADCDCDGDVDFLDIQSFIDILANAP